MSEDGWDQQNHNQSGQQPDRPNNERARESQIDPAYGEKRQQRLPARLGFIDMVGLIGHRVGIAKISGCASAAAIAASLCRGAFDELKARRQSAVATAPDRDIAAKFSLTRFSINPLM